MEWLTELMNGFGVTLVQDPFCAISFLIGIFLLEVIITPREEPNKKGMGTREF